MENNFLCLEAKKIMASIDREIKSKFKDDRHRLMTNIIYTANWIQGNFNEFLKPYGLSSQQYNILRILRGKGAAMTMNDVKAVMIERAPNATRLSDKLLEKGLIERDRTKEDRRIVMLSITSKGLKLMDEIDQVQNAEFEALMSRIEPNKAKEFSDFLDKMRG